MERQLKKIWICTDIWMDILPFFRRPQLGLTLALLSPRFDVLVDAHFSGKSELTLWRPIRIYENTAEQKAKLSMLNGSKFMDFPLPDYPLPYKIRFHNIRIDYIDHSIVEFLRANQQIWDKGINLYLHLCSSDTNVQPIWDVFVRQILPIFTKTNVHHLEFDYGGHLGRLLRLTSPTILLDLNINSFQSNGDLFPDVLGDDFDGPNATPTAGQVLSKWLHIPTTDGRPTKLRCLSLKQQPNLEWLNSFKETFLCATSSVSYQMNFKLNNSTPIEPFELLNEQTKEKLTLEQVTGHPGKWLLKRSQINGETAAIKWENGENLDANLNNA